METQAYTIDEFCKAHRISRAGLYNRWKEGKGPRFHYNGSRRLISVEAAREWQRQMEEDAAAGLADATA
jgi:hypothetical protein